MIVTRITCSKNLNAKKLDELTTIAKLLGEIRKEVWQRYGSISGVGRTYFDIRNEWMRSGRKFDLPARLWKETLHGILVDIKASKEAAKKSLHRAIFARVEYIGKEREYTKEQIIAERKRLFTLLKYDKWMDDSYLRRMMRKKYRHGKTNVDTHIKLDSDCYKWFLKDGHGWIEVMSLVFRKRIAIPLASNHPISGTICLIVKEKEVEIHHTIEAPIGKSCGTKIIGIDKGYTEAFVDSDGDRHGEGLGKLLSKKSDSNKLKYQRRNKIKAIADKSEPSKKDRIIKNNLGRQKLDNQKRIHKQKVKTICYEAAHSVVDKAKVIAAEDLTSPIKDRNTKRIKGSNEKRRLSGWVKGILAEALDTVSHRRGSTVSLVNSAYSSQVHSRCGCLGIRNGDVLHCDICREDAPSDREAAREVLARLHDSEISRWTPYQKVKSILQERTSRYRLGLLNQDSSCATVVSTESELPSLLIISNCDQ